MADIGMPDGRRNMNRGGRSHPAPTVSSPDPRHHKAVAKAEAAQPTIDPAPVDPPKRKRPTVESAPEGGE